MAPPTRPLAERFWEKVRKADGCWEWTGYVDKGGYGKLTIGRGPVRAHRISWELEHGPIPRGMLICHHCDNPPCVRPDHLFIGTTRDNSRDRDAKGRTSRMCGGRGERHRSAKLTEGEVRQIFDLRRAGWMTVEIAALYGLQNSTITDIVTGGTWRHLGIPPVRGVRIRHREADLS